MRFYPLMGIVDLEDFFFLSRGYIEMLLGDPSSLVVISDCGPIRLLHASLGDFILDLGVRNTLGAVLEFEKKATK